VPLSIKLPFWISEKNGRLVLREDISNFLLQFAETQETRKIRKRKSNDIVRRRLHMKRICGKMSNR